MRAGGTRWLRVESRLHAQLGHLHIRPFGKRPGSPTGREVMASGGRRWMPPCKGWATGRSEGAFSKRRLSDRKAQ